MGLVFLDRKLFFLWVVARPDVNLQSLFREVADIRPKWLKLGLYKVFLAMLDLSTLVLFSDSSFVFVGGTFKNFQLELIPFRSGRRDVMMEGAV